MASTSLREAGAALSRPCNATAHEYDKDGWTVAFTRNQHNPDCGTCQARAVLAQHDHLHLGANEPPCTTIGLSGKPGEMVKCSCGSFHH